MVILAFECVERCHYSLELTKKSSNVSIPSQFDNQMHVLLVSMIIECVFY